MTTLQLPHRAFRQLRLDEIDMPDFDLRTDIGEDDLRGLGETIADFGPLQPIFVSLDSRTGRHKLIIGGRRIRAVKKAGGNTIESLIMDDVDDKTALIYALIENMQRIDLEPLEEARGMAELRDRFKFDEDKIARTIGKRTQFVEERLALLRLPDRIREKLKTRRLGVSQAVPITRLEGMEKTQLEIADRAEEHNLSSEMVGRLVEEVARPKRRRRKMMRQHKLKKQGKPFTNEHMDGKIQLVVLRGEQLLELLDGFPMSRWSAEKADKLHQAICAVQQGLQRFQQRAAKRAKNTE